MSFGLITGHCLASPRRSWRSRQTGITSSHPWTEAGAPGHQRSELVKGESGHREVCTPRIPRGPGQAKTWPPIMGFLGFPTSVPLSHSPRNPDLHSPHHQLHESQSSYICGNIREKSMLFDFTLGHEHLVFCCVFFLKE